MQIIPPYDHTSSQRTIVEAMRELHEFRVAWYEHFGYSDVSVIRRMTYGTPMVEEEKSESQSEVVEQPKKRKGKRNE